MTSLNKQHRSGCVMFRSGQSQSQGAQQNREQQRISGAEIESIYARSRPFIVNMIATKQDKEKVEKKLLYNAIAEDTIDEELASNLTEDYILPWERCEDGHSFRLRRSLFDQIMLVRRLEEEQSILVKEMSQHITSLRKEIKGVEKLKENIRMGYFGDMSEDAAAGWKSVLMRRSSALEVYANKL
ncbi:uncharacterized protein LOC143738554 [Siphateles boraxobius]|uniref:uncharacterized protein LOC143738554 n=1 Tax=Siphateles boraxobius TaxID=180520 RepID=UPI004062E2D0